MPRCLIYIPPMNPPRWSTLKSKKLIKRTSNRSTYHNSRAKMPSAALSPEIFNAKDWSCVYVVLILLIRSQNFDWSFLTTIKHYFYERRDSIPITFENPFHPLKWTPSHTHPTHSYSRIFFAIKYLRGYVLAREFRYHELHWSTCEVLV